MEPGDSMHIRDRIVELRRVKASELIPNPRNWRTHPKAQADALKGILAEAGYVDALLARETDTGLMLIDGHLRAETTPDTEVPVLILDVDEAEADKILATFDPLGAMAEADAAKLDALLREVDTGSEALQEMLADLATDAGLYQTPAEVTEDEVPEPPAVPVTKPGDLWILGDRRLLCGDSTKSEDVARLMQGERADLCFTSPPYAQQRDYTAESKGQDWDALMRGVFGNLPMSEAGQVLVNLGLVHRDGEWVPYWDGWIAWMREQGWRRFGWYVWDQGYGLPGDWNGRFAPSHEFVFHFNRQSVKPEKVVPKDPENVRDRSGDTTMRGDLAAGRPMSSGEASLQTHKIPDSVIRVQRQCGRVTQDQHYPAVFPVEFPAFAMRCWPGLVYEPFCGSGTTIIAAEQLGRRCCGMEISPAYCDVIVQRWEKLTGKKAKRDRPAKSPKPQKAKKKVEPKARAR
jgi:DNA modification methylase